MATYTVQKSHGRLTQVDTDGNEQIIYPQSTATDVLLKNKSNGLPTGATTVDDVMSKLGKAAFGDGLNASSFDDGVITSSETVTESGHIPDAILTSNLYKKMGSTAISSIGDGTVSGAIFYLNQNGTGGGGTSSSGASVIYLSATLDPNSWSSGTYTISNENIKETSIVEVAADQLTQEQYEALANAYIYKSVLSAGKIVLYSSGTTPDISLPITLVIGDKSSTNAFEATDFLSVNLLPATWANGEYTIEDTRFEESSVLEIMPDTMDDATYQALSEACIISSATTAGSITLKALGTVPTVSIPIVIQVGYMRSEVNLGTLIGQIVDEKLAAKS